MLKIDAALPNQKYLRETEKITQQERETLSCLGNLADAQVYIPLTRDQLSALPSIEYVVSMVQSYSEEKERLLNALRTFHQVLDIPKSEDVMFTYSASSGIEIIANCLRLSKCHRVALIHPTYDATYHILKRHGCQLIPLNDANMIADPIGLLRSLPDIDCVFLTLPNNPTGRDMEAATFQLMCHYCNEKGIKVVLDCCFRSYSATPVNHYKIIKETGVTAAVVEDMGKLFSVKDLKLGLLSANGSIASDARDVHRDFLLEPPIINLVLLGRLLEITGPEYAASLRQIVDTNRIACKMIMSRSKLHAEGESKSNVQLLILPEGMTGASVRSRAFDRGIGIVEASKYFWAEEFPPECIRIALARPVHRFSSLMEELNFVFQNMQMT